MAGDSGMFGGPIGDLAYTGKENVEAQTLHSLSQTAMMPYQAQHLQAQSRLLAAQAGNAEVDLEANKLMAETMRRMSGGATVTDKPMTMSEQLTALAETALGAGAVTKGRALATAASQVQLREIQGGLAKSRAEVQRLRAVGMQADTVGRLFGEVSDQAAFDRANDQYTFQTGQQSPYAGREFTPELVKQIHAAALTTKEQSELGIKDTNAKSLESFRQARLDQRDFENTLREDRQRLAREREERLAKSGGGKGVSSPAKAELDQARLLVKKDYDGMNPADLSDAAYNIAADAKALRRTNPALDSAAALTQAYQNAKAAGDFGSDAGWGGSGISAKPTYMSQGKTEAAPAKLPSDKGSLKEGRFYTNAQGVVAKWNGKAFVPVKGARALPSNNPRVITPGVPDSSADDEDADPEEGDD